MKDADIVKNYRYEIAEGREESESRVDYRSARGTDNDRFTMNYGKSYNRGTPFLEKYIQDSQENEEERNDELSCKTANKFPWLFGKSDYSSASSPGTGSSGSSTNSQSYGRSPDDLSVDYLINSLLQVVNGDRFGGGAGSDPTKSSENGQWSEKGCNDRCTGGVACDMCNENQESVMNEHHHHHHHHRHHHHHHHHHGQAISNERTVAAAAAAAVAAAADPSSVVNAPISTTTILPLYCDIHKDAQRFYCQTCSKPLCGECGIQHHHGHITVHLMEAVEGAGIQANRVMKEARLGITVLRKELDAVQIAAETLEQKARQAAADVMLCVRRVASALEAREKELLGRIEKARLLKFAALKVRDEGLRNGMARLSQAVDRLADAMESKTLTSNPLELLLTKDMASAEVFQIRKTRQSLPSPEENWISFTGLEGSIIQAIGNLGSIVVNNPGPIGDRRAVRGRGSSPQTFYRYSATAAAAEAAIPLLSVPRGRPIPLNSFPVIVRANRESYTPSKPLVIIGNDGETRDNLCRPWGIACDREGHIIVADRSNNRIQIYRQEDGSFVRRFGTHGTAPGQFDRPAGVAVDARRRIIIADKDNHRIQVVTMEGVFLLSFGEKGCRYGQFNYPWDVAVNSECQIAVSDTRNHRVQLFSPEGVFLRKYGYEAAPNMWKHFDSPRGVAFNPEGNVVTTDFNNHRVITIDADFMNARVFDREIGSGGGNGGGSGGGSGGGGGGGGSKQFLRPQGLVVDDEGNIVIADSRNHRIQVFDSSGNLKWKYGCYGKGIDEMDRPSGIALCPDGRIAVVDFGNNRILLI